MIKIRAIRTAVFAVSCCAFAVAGRAEGLAPNALSPLPLGAVRPEGWLKYQLSMMTEGLVGRLYENNEFLSPSNGWICAGGSGWEEQPYWLRSFVKLSVLTQNERCLAVSRDWMEKMLLTVDEDGWFGPADIKRRKFANGAALTDIWPHMVMVECVRNWYEYTRDERYLKMLIGFVNFCAKIPEDEFMTPKAYKGKWNVPFDWHFVIQANRPGGMLPTLYWLYELTGEKDCLVVADRCMKYFSPKEKWISRHTVDFAMRFAFSTVYSRYTRSLSDKSSAERWYQAHMDEWGQMPRGLFAADEQIREGFTDPRYATESCTFGEFVRSFNLVGDVTGEAVWADRCEDIVYNHACAAYTPDWKEVHYLTAANQVSLDARTDHNYFNGPPQIAYSSKIFRCCRHNAALTYPLFTENLVKRASDGTLVFWMYAPSSGSLKLQGGSVEWTMDTKYPFREDVILSFKSASPVKIRLRVPRWAKGFCAGDVCAVPGAEWVDLSVPAGNSIFDISMKAVAELTQWPKTGAVTVERGPLSYSVAIQEKYARIRRPKIQGGSPVWAEDDLAEGFPKDFMTEVLPLTPWNWAVDAASPLEYRELKFSENCFVSTNAPSEITVKCRRLPEWVAQDAQPAELQQSPAYTKEPLTRVRFVPIACQRCRLGVLPTATDDVKKGNKWKMVPSFTKRENRRRR